MPEKWEELRDRIVSSIESRAQTVLAENAGSKLFVEERAGRLAKLGVEYLAAKTDDDKAAIEERMQSVRQAMENEIGTVLTNASDKAKSWFKDIAGVVFDTVISFLPAVGPLGKLIKKT